MNKHTFLKTLVAFAFMATALVACNKNEDPVTPTATAPYAPTGLMANSMNETTVRLKWTASTSASRSDFGGYMISVNSKTYTTTGTMMDITGLTAGTVYNFSVMSQLTGGSKMSETDVKVSWAPAKRFTGVKLYETDSQLGSGLDLFDPATSSFALLRVADGAKWDIGLDTRNSSFDIGSPSKTSYTIASPRATLLGKIYNNVTSLDEVFDTAALTTTGEALINFNNVTTGFAFVAKTADGNFAKVLVKATGGKILQGTAPNRYVDIDYSYQTLANVAYAMIIPKFVPEFTTKVGDLTVTNKKKVAPIGE